MSEGLFEDIIGFLAEHDDRENTELLCDLARASKGYDLYFISDILLDNKKPAWALPYSLRLIGEEDADEDDEYQHLFILNEMGNGHETLLFADALYRNAIENGASEDASLFKHLIKQIKSRGRFKTPRE